MLPQLMLHGTGGANARSQSITLKTLPRSVFYAYTFLISSIVQLDPIGRHPKCLHFAAAGLERLVEMFDFGWDFRSPEVLEGKLTFQELRQGGKAVRHNRLT